MNWLPFIKIVCWIVSVWWCARWVAMWHESLRIHKLGKFGDLDYFGEGAKRLAGLILCQTIIWVLLP